MDKCPACERKFERIKDFPLVEIVEFKRLKIPEMIGGHFLSLHPEKKLRKGGNKPLPEEVLKLFKKTSKDVISYEGIVYKKIHYDQKENVQWYSSSKDITDIVKKTIETKELQRTLSALESYVGKEVRTKDLLNLPGFKKMRVGDYNDISLSFFNERKKEDLRVCNLTLDGGWSGGTISVASISQNLAELHYIGKINQ